MELTEAEKHFDKLLAERRSIGRTTYGQGLKHDDIYCWDQMALEEALDLAQYLAVRNLQLQYQMRERPPVSDQEMTLYIAKCVREAIAKELTRLSHFEVARVVRGMELPDV